MTKAPSHKKTSSSAFTLVELLISVGIIALLIGILLPSITASRSAAKAIVCQSNLRQIGAVVRLYLNANRGTLPTSTPGGQWVTTTVPLTVAKWLGSKSYWGVAYLPYLNPKASIATGADASATIYAAAQIWRCPGRMVVDPGGSNPDEGAPQDYGINFCISGSQLSTKWNKPDRYKNAAEIIFCQDACDQHLGDNADYDPCESGDMLSDFGGGQGNLRAWRPGGSLCERYAPGSTTFLNEFYRHRKRCQCLCLDGHVTSFAMSDGSDIPASWYWGQTTAPK